MKVIFLDFDGVLNVMSDGKDEFGDCFHPPFVNNLKSIIEHTGAKIVVSSSWRIDGMEKVMTMWQKRNLPGEVIDATPTIFVQKDRCIQFWNNNMADIPTNQIPGYAIPRGCEIDYWLKNQSSSVQNYVILDDSSDMLWEQKDNFVLCRGNTDHEDNMRNGFGLTKKRSEKAIEILNQVNSKKEE